MSLWTCAFLAVIIACAISSGDAVKCFECNSERDPACGDPFLYTHLPLIDCERKNQFQPQSQTYTGSRSVCKKTKTRVNGFYVVDRTCALEETYGMDPCGGSRNYGYRDSNSAYQSNYPANNYGSNSNYGSNQYGANQYGSNNQYGANQYGSNQNYGSYGPDHCSVCRYDGCNGATGLAPALWSLLLSFTALTAYKCL